MEKVSAKDFDAKVLKEKCFVVVEFSGKQCGPCQQMAPVMRRVVESYKDKPYVKFVEVDTGEYPELVERYHVASIPHWILFYKGKQVGETFGRKSEDGIREFIGMNVRAMNDPEFFKE